MKCIETDIWCISTNGENFFGGDYSSREEAIEAIKCNYPPENYSVLREALDMTIEALKEVKEGQKIGELTFWYSKCEKGIYRIESNEY